MILSTNQAACKQERMSAKPNFWSATFSSHGQAHVWKDGQLEFVNYILYDGGTLKYVKGGNTHSAVESGSADLKSIQFAGKGKVLLEKSDGSLFFKKTSPLPDDLSVILLFRYGKKLIFLITDQNFSKYSQWLEVDATPHTVSFCILTMCGWIRYRDPSAANQIQQWVLGIRNPLGKEK